jgi:23S rRNA pseudouridine2605 synthase
MGDLSHCGILIKTYNARSSESRNGVQRPLNEDNTGIRALQRIRTISCTSIFEKQSAIGLKFGPEPLEILRRSREGLLSLHTAPSRKAVPILSNPGSNETSNPAIPTAAQLGETRLKQWHQQGEALLTIENLRGWINAAGLVLFAPRPQIASPAPSLVEAVLGAPNPSPTIEQTAESRSLLARLVAEGLAVPLNLLGPGMGTVHAGAPGDTPDFVASTAVFSYVFTLRGDKAWKQPPATSGAMKVSNLALAIFEALTRRGALSAYDLTTEVGKDVTEAAVLRALGELWTHLRVLPLAQPDGAATLWELASARFTKQIKAGANAGQPSALSALISLYLGQAVVAAEDEIESFLSPLASRSRIRDVIHALLAARELETIAVEGRTMLHVAGALPAFLAPAAIAATDADAAGEIQVEAVAGEEADGTEEVPARITKFVPKPRKIGTGYLAKAKPSKFAAKPFGASKPGFGAKPGFKPRTGAGLAPDRERRPFSKPAGGGFDKPWDEEKTRRMAAASKPSEVREEAGEATEPRAARVYKPRAEGGGDRPRFGGKPAFRGKPSFGDKPAFGGKPSFRGKPSFGEGRPPRRDFAPRAEGEGDARPPRKTFSKPGTFGRKREGFASRSGAGDERPARREFSPRPGQGGDRRPGPRPDRGERPDFGGSRGGGSYTPRPQGDRPRRSEGEGSAPRKPFAPRGAGFFSAKPRTSDGPARGPREGQDRGAGGEGGKRVYRKFDAPRDRPARPYSSDRPARPYSSDRPARAEGGEARKPAGDFAKRKFGGKLAGKPGGFGGKSGGKPGGFGGKKSFSKSDKPFGGKPSSTFAKFADNKKPFGKRAPARKFKPGKGESAG